MDTIILRQPDDFHLHVRQGESLGPWLRESSAVFSRAIIMPNTVPGITTTKQVQEYRQTIEEAAAQDAKANSFTPLMSFKLLPGMSKDDIQAFADCGCLIGKYYPAGATTNSSEGVASPDSVIEALASMEALGLVLSVHAEDPDLPVLEREEGFIPTLERIISLFPRLKIVVEHLSDRRTVEWISRQSQRVAATLTLHHLLFSLDDMMGGGLNPHLFCKPCIKQQVDRDCLREAATSGDARFFFGSDSAPHPRGKKESASAPGGIFSSPVLMPCLTELFISQGKIDRLEDFCSRFGAVFYGLPLNSHKIQITTQGFTVPEEIGGAVPLFAGKRLTYKVSCIE